MKKLLLALPAIFVAGVAFAEEAATGGGSGAGAYTHLAAGLAIGLGVFGGALAQGKTASSALEGISRNPSAADKVFTPMILGLALIESLVLFSFVIAFLLQGK